MSDATQKYIRIPLTQGKYAVIDIEDFAEIGKYRWNAVRAGAVRTLLKSESGGAKMNTSMHRQIMNPPEGMCVDHKDRNVLNNTRENLRICTHFENMRNVKPKNGKSGIKGVAHHLNRWQATICFNKEHIYLGSFKCKEDAAKAYSNASKELHGEFGRTEVTPFQDYSHIPIAQKTNNRPSKSGEYGVYRNKKRWVAQIRINGINTHLGIFDKKEDAAARVKSFTDKTR